MTSKLEATIYAPLHAPVLLPDTKVVEHEGWFQTITPSFRAGSENRVMLSLNTGGDTNKCIHETLASYKENNIPFSWSIGPMSAKELEKPLLKKSDKIVDFCGMAVDTDKVIVANDSVEVEVLTQKNFEEFLNALITGWSMQEYTEKVREKYLRILKNPQLIHYLARKNNIVVGTSGIIIKKDYAYLIGGNILSEHRGQGAYRAMVKKRLQDLKRMKISLAVTHAKGDTSAPILTQLGFETVFHAKSCYL